MYGKLKGEDSIKRPENLVVNYKGLDRLDKPVIYFLWIKIKTIVQLLELSAGLALTEPCVYSVG